MFLPEKGEKMTIKDRGLMKFRTVALQPGFISNLKKMHREQEYVKPPELDEQQLDYLNTKICESMEFTQQVTVTYFKNHASMKEDGYIHFFDEKRNEIRLISKKDTCVIIPLSKIIDVT
jgi:hypothetical protein